MAKEKKLLPKQELFIDRYFELSKNAVRAYREVYGAGKNMSYGVASAAASRLLKDEKIKEEVAKREIEMQENSKIKKDELINDLKAIKDSNIFDYLKVVKKTKKIQTIDAETGLPCVEEKTYYDMEYKPSDELTLEQQKQVRSIEVMKNGSIKYTLHDKARAIDDLSKLLGMYNTQIAVNAVDTSSLNNLSFEELEKLMLGNDDSDDDN